MLASATSGFGTITSGHYNRQKQTQTNSSHLVDDTEIMENPRTGEIEHMMENPQTATSQHMADTPLTPTSPQITDSQSLYQELYKEYDVLDRVVHLPVVSTTFNAVHDYYTKMKKAYPTLSPYLQAAEDMTYSAALLALRSSKPVMDKFGPTLNAYANTGLDKLEGSIPMIKKHPKEVIEETKSSATNMISSKVDRALCITEQYVDYYLPSDHTNTMAAEYQQEDNQDSKDQTGAKERFNIISHKVKKRSYKRAMQSWSGIRTRSEEALNKLNFTVDLIEYAKNCLTSNKKACTKHQGALQEGDLDRNDDDMQNDIVSVDEKCQVPDEKTYGRLSDNLFSSAFSDKTYSSILDTARYQIRLVEDTLFYILDNIALVPPVAWMTLNFDEDPLDGMGMYELELQLNDRPVDGGIEQLIIGPPVRDCRQG